MGKWLKDRIQSRLDNFDQYIKRLPVLELAEVAALAGLMVENNKMLIDLFQSISAQHERQYHMTSSSGNKD